MTILRVLCILVTMVLMTTGEESKLVSKILSKPEDCKVEAREGDVVVVHFVSKFKDGTVLNSTYHNKEPLRFTIGSKQVLSGLEYGVLQMCVGEKRFIEVPPQYAYGVNGRPPAVPPNAYIFFETELMELHRPLTAYLNDRRLLFAGYIIILLLIMLFIIFKCLPNLPSQKKGKVSKSKKTD